MLTKTPLQKKNERIPVINLALHVNEKLILTAEPKKKNYFFHFKF